VKASDRRVERRTSAQLDKAAKITDADIERAQARWKKHAPPRVKNILEAKRRRRTQ
jgi:ribosomal protein S30